MFSPFLTKLKAVEFADIVVSYTRFVNPTGEQLAKSIRSYFNNYCSCWSRSSFSDHH